MNPRALPLALSLALALAASARAQFTSAPTSSWNPFANPSPLGTGFDNRTAPVTDMAIKCETVPYRACTPEERAAKQQFLRTCDRVNDARCQDAWMRNQPPQSPVQQLGQTPDVEWANPNCTHIPCAVKNQPTTGAATSPTNASSRVPVPGDPDFIGPVLPDQQRNAGPQPFRSSAERDAAMKEQEAVTGPGSVVPLPNNTYAYRTPDGKFVTGGLCGGSPCSSFPPKDNPELAAKLEQYNQEQTQAGNQNPPNNFTALKNPPADDSGSRTPASDDGSGRDDGKTVGGVAMRGKGSGGGGSGAPGSASGTGRGGQGGGGTSDDATGTAVIRIAASQIAKPDQIKLTFKHTVDASEPVQGAQQIIKTESDKKDGVFEGKIDDLPAVTTPKPTRAASQ